MKSGGQYRTLGDIHTEGTNCPESNAPFTVAAIEVSMVEPVTRSIYLIAPWWPGEDLVQFAIEVVCTIPLEVTTAEGFGFARANSSSTGSNVKFDIMDSEEDFLRRQCLRHWWSVEKTVTRSIYMKTWKVSVSGLRRDKMVTSIPDILDILLSGSEWGYQ